MPRAVPLAVSAKKNNNIVRHGDPTTYPCTLRQRRVMPGLRTAEAYWEARYRAQGRWKKFRLGTKLNIGLGAAAMSSFMQRETLKLEELTKQGKVVTSQVKRGSEVSYLEQGDKAMCLGPGCTQSWHDSCSILVPVD